MKICDGEDDLMRARLKLVWSRCASYNGTERKPEGGARRKLGIPGVSVVDLGLVAGAGSKKEALGEP